MPPASHDGKALAHILDTFPRDELFQVSEDELYAIAMGILRLGGRPKVRLFLRFDRFDRFVSALLFVPRDHIDTAVRGAHPRHSGPRAQRPHVGLRCGDRRDRAGAHPLHHRPQSRPAPASGHRARWNSEIPRRIRTWDDGFVEAMCARHGRSEGARLAAARAAKFSPGYQGHFPAHEAVRDLEILELLAASPDPVKVAASVWRKEGDAAPCCG